MDNMNNNEFNSQSEYVYSNNDNNNSSFVNEEDNNYKKNNTKKYIIIVCILVLTTAFWGTGIALLSSSVNSSISFIETANYKAFVSDVNRARAYVYTDVVWRNKRTGVVWNKSTGVSVYKLNTSNNGVPAINDLINTDNDTKITRSPFYRSYSDDSYIKVTLVNHRISYEFCFSDGKHRLYSNSDAFGVDDVENTTLGCSN